MAKKKADQPSAEELANELVSHIDAGEGREALFDLASFAPTAEEIAAAKALGADVSRKVFALGMKYAMARLGMAGT